MKLLTSRSCRLVLPSALVFVASACFATEQGAPAASTAAAGPAPVATGQAATTAAPTANETIVSRIALYPDDLVSVILPASTYPLQIIEAARYLDRRAKDPKLPLDDKWDDSVKTLLNYPTVIKEMDKDLDWLGALGDAVTADQSAVLSAVQSYRRKVYAAGNLKSDGKQVVAMNQDIITITPADPQVIYVPQYNPTTVVYSGYAGYGYYGVGYPSYYYPYPPGAALATGLIWGAAMGAIWNGGHYVSHYGGYGGNNIRINNGDINIGSGNRVDGGDRNRVNAGDRSSAGAGNRATAGSRDWKPSSQARASTGRVGDPARGGAAGGSLGTGNRGASAGQYGPSGGAGNRGGAGAGQYGPSAGNRASTGNYGGNRASGGGYGGAYGGAYGGSRGGYGGGASSFNGYSSGRSANMASSRGAMSRGGGGRRR